MIKTLSLAALLAAEIGAPVPATFEAPRAPVVRETELVRAAAPEPRKGALEGPVPMEGGALLNCDEAGWRSGWISLRSVATVVIPGGVTADIPVRGSVFVSGACQKDRGGYLTGSGSVYGDGFLYKNGARAGYISLEGTAAIHEFSSRDDVWVRDFVALVGEYRLD